MEHGNSIPLSLLIFHIYSDFMFIVFGIMGVEALNGSTNTNTPTHTDEHKHEHF